MSSDKSPYKELGIRACDVLQRRKRAPERLPKLCVDMKKFKKDGHDFQPQSFIMRKEAGAAIARANSTPCRRCGHPRFAVDGLKCKGRKP